MNTRFRTVGNTAKYAAVSVSNGHTSDCIAAHRGGQFGGFTNLTNRYGKSHRFADKSCEPDVGLFYFIRGHR